MDLHFYKNSKIKLFFIDKLSTVNISPKKHDFISDFPPVLHNKQDGRL